LKIGDSLPLKAGGEHQGNGVEQRGKIMLAYPAGEFNLPGGE